MQRGNYARLTQLATVAVEAGYEVPREFTSLKARERAQEARYPARQINKIWHFDTGGGACTGTGDHGCAG